MRTPRHALVLRAPLALVRAWAWGLLVVVATALVTAAAVAPPLFVTAAEDAALQEVRAAADEQFGGRSVDLRVTWEGVVDAEAARDLDDDLRDLPWHGEPVTTTFGSGAGRAVSPVVIKDGRQAVATLWSRDGAVEMLEEGGTSPAPVPDGAAAIWLPADVAATLGAGPGDRVRLGLLPYATPRPRRTVGAVVAGVFQPARGAPLPAPLMASGVDASLLPLNTSGDDGQPLAVADERTTERLLLRMGDTPRHVDDVPLDPRLDPAAARAAVEAVDETTRDLVAGRGAFLLGQARPAPAEALVASDLDEVVDAAADAAAASRVQVTPFVRATLGGAAVMLLACLVLLARSRSLELRALADLGARPRVAALLGALEAFLPALLGAGLGVLAGWAAVAVSGPPGRQAGPDAVSTSLSRAAVVLVAAVVLAAVVRVAALVVATAATRSLGRRSFRGLSWTAVLGLLVVVAAAVVVVAVVSLDVEDRALGPLAALLPLAVAAGAAVVVVGGGGAVAERFAGLGSGARGRRWGARRGSAWWLGRARAGGRRAVVVSVGMATVLGVLGYGIAARHGVDVAVADKAAAQVGARVRVDVGDQLGGLRFTRADALAGPRGTVVYRRGVSIPPTFGDRPLLAVDPDALARVADWGASLAEEGRAALARLGPPETDEKLLPVVVAGETERRVGEVLSLTFSGQPLARGRVVAVVAALPGTEATPSDETLVIDRKALFDLLPEDLDPRTPVGEFSGAGVPAAEIWSDEDPAAVERRLRDGGVEPVEVDLRSQVRTQPSLLAARWAVDYLAPWGLACVLLVVGLTLLVCRRALDRDAVSDVVLRRAGWSARARTLARVREVAGVVAGAALSGAVGVALLLLSPTVLETVPAVQPVTRPRLDGAGAGVWAAVVVATLLCAVVALVAGQDRRSAAEVLRGLR